MIEIDRRTIMQIIGTLMASPSILSDIDKYQLNPNDFVLPLDKYIFSAIYNLYAGGAEKIHAIDIDNYLSTNEYAHELLEKGNGITFLQDCENYSELQNFPYYYNRFKKLILLRELEKNGHNISNFYSDNPLDENHIAINERFEQLTPTDIVNKLKIELSVLEENYTTNSQVEEGNAFDGIKTLINDLKTKPEIGCKLQGEIFNTITRGGRKGKLYLRSASSGVGKTRNMVGDACNIAYPIRYDLRLNKWVSTGSCEKVLYIMTEQHPSEIQTMILAYLTGYNEDMFLYGTFQEEHMERILKAIDIMERYKSNMLFARIPDPCASVVKNLFRKYNFQYGVENFFYDYIFSSPAMLAEYRDLKLREDVVLRLFTTALKNLAVELNAFVLTSTQISNDDDKNGGFRDYRNIQGSRAIVNLVDFACIMSRPTDVELQLVQDYQRHYNLTPNCITDVFKNRRGRWTMVRIWSTVDLGTCRRYDLFVTSANNQPLDEFQIVNFTNIGENFADLENLYNNGEVTDDEAERLLNNVSTEEKLPINLIDEITKAFGDISDNKKRMSELNLEDLI